MSRREWPSSGYVVPLDKIRDMFSEEKNDELQELLENGEPEDLDDFLEKSLPQGFPVPLLYCPSSEDTVDDPMFQGEWCAVFTEDELYEKIETPSMKKLKEFGITPEFCSWSVYG